MVSAVTGATRTAPTPAHGQAARARGTAGMGDGRAEQFSQLFPTAGFALGDIFAPHQQFLFVVTVAAEEFVEWHGR
jgi:hypothetical protein